jgi:serine/threonine-protein phosphatase 6 regulatory ankyrin repeat subunit B
MNDLTINDVASPDKFGETALITACKSNDYDLFKRLLESGISNPEFKSKTVENVLITACRMHKLSFVKLLFDIVHVNPNSTTTYGGTALTILCHHYDPEIISILIQNGANVNHVTHDNRTPLTIACHMQNVELVKTLLDAGASLAHQDKHNNTTLMTLADQQQTIETKQILQLLLNHPSCTKSLLNVENTSGNTLFLIAVRHNIDWLVNVLATKNVNIYQFNNVGHNALAIACYNGHSQLVKVFLDNWAFDPNFPHHHGNTVLINVILEQTPNYNHVVDVLICHKKTKINTANKFGFTALHYASKNNNEETIIKLLKHGANPSLVNKHSETPFMLSAAYKSGSPSDKSGSPSDKSGSPSDKSGSPSDKSNQVLQAYINHPGSTFDIKPSTFKSPIIIAFHHNNFDFLQLLLETTAHDLNKIFSEHANAGFNMLMFAVNSKNTYLFHKVLTFDFDVTANFENVITLIESNHNKKNREEVIELILNDPRLYNVDLNKLFTSLCDQSDFAIARKLLWSRRITNIIGTRVYRKLVSAAFNTHLIQTNLELGEFLHDLINASVFPQISGYFELKL